MVEKDAIKDAANDAAVAAARATWPQTRVVVRVVLLIVIIILVVIGAILLVRKLTGVILLVVLAVFFAYLVAPLVEIVRRPLRILGRRQTIPRGIAIGIVYVALFGALSVGVSYLYPSVKLQVKDLWSQRPQYTENFKQSDLFQRLNRRYQQLPERSRAIIDNKITQSEDYATDTILASTSFLGFLPWLILIPILAFFLLKDADSFRRSLLQMMPSGRWRWRADEFVQDVSSTLAAYIRAQLIACLLIGVICTLGFLVLDVPYALLLGTLAGLFEFVPLVGPLAIAIIALIITSFDSSFNHALLVLLFLGVLRIVHDYVTYPRIIGQGIHLHPLAVILAVLSGAELAGIAGIFLAIPVVAIATVTYRHWLEHRGSMGLVADLLQGSTAQVVSPDLETTAEWKRPDHFDMGPGVEHPSPTTTPDDMARLRPDLTSGQLKMPNTE